MNKPLIILAALTLFCCITTLHAASWSGCRCIRTVSKPVPLGVIDKIEVIPPSGRCRRVERIIYRKNGSKVCINPNAEWFLGFLRAMDRRNHEAFSSTTQPPTASVGF
ncbi:C-X-C motif chemokine 13-like isoform 1-T1 [Odontesthes bonariensis]|uniref:C-X-C motif chemokine 13 isoform X1 n=1 Tax=Odontesthes bonariensis TaxID=219752 RepID=UPI003F588096